MFTCVEVCVEEKCVHMCRGKVSMYVEVSVSTCVEVKCVHVCRGEVCPRV